MLQQGSVFLKYPDVINLHLLRENGGRIGIARPDTTYSYIENEELLEVKLCHVPGCDINFVEFHIVNIPLDGCLIPDNGKHMIFISEDSR